MNEIRPEEYLRNFPYDSTPTSMRHAALAEARENRKFEIGLYWTRAAYFWVFIAVAFGGYSVLQKEHHATAFLTACVGFIFSLAWYFVNRGSKFWQQNWELHVDLLEDKIAGPVYKTVIQRTQCSLVDFNGAYPFSVSKINQLLSLFVTVVWVFMIVKSFAVIWNLQFILSPRIATIFLLICTLVAAILLFCLGRTGGLKRDVTMDTFFQSRRALPANRAAALDSSSELA